MKQDLIDMMVISSMILIAILFLHPMKELRLENFYGLFSVVLYFIGKNIVRNFFLKKWSQTPPRFGTRGLC